jgi:hypothetical protein
MVTTADRRERNKLAQRRFRQRSATCRTKRTSTVLLLIIKQAKELERYSVCEEAVTRACLQALITRGRGLAKESRRACLEESEAPNPTARSGGNCDHKQSSTLAPHPAASPTVLPALNRRPDALRLFGPNQASTNTHKINTGSETDYTNSFFRSPLFNLRFRFPPDEDFAIAKFQYEVTSKLFQWLVPVPSLPPVEIDFLHDLLQLWHKKDIIFRREFGAQYNAIYRVFEGWIKGRLNIAVLYSKLSSQSGPPPSVSTTIEQIHALNALRVEKLTLLHVCADEKLRNKLLAKVFSLLTETNGTDHVFLEGICRLQQGDMSMLGMTGL